MTDHPAGPPPVTVHETLPARVLIGPGARRTVPGECERLGVRRVLLVSTPSAATPADELADALGPRLAARFGRPAAHTPVAVTADALRLVDQVSADGVVAIGGGSAVGLAKALAVRTGIPQIAVPTTYAGSEATPVLGETENGVKTTRRAPDIAPGTIVYDPELTLTLPPGLTLTSALNALAHAVEALWAPDATPVSDALATEAAAGLLTALPLVLAEPAHPAHRGRLQSSAWLAGLCLAGTRMGLHHQLAHALGGTYDLPHAPLHALLLPHVMAFNLPSAPDAAARLSRATGGADPVAAVARLARSYDGPTTLAALGVPHDGLPTIAARVAAAPHPNPRPVTADSVTEILEAAF
ncbi:MULTISPECIES: maleylacetate reductase [unclassified Streptomyces]|uniref:maleylacetate reductase n=1 Tax=unclassified Streptomyces TaxID=2593676 RepID=UPI000DB9625A|nr:MULTISPECIES: maleylacetate reductase [unclassified Streptomyces]MYT73621.1 iron-containing alcohol dehydrogenase [Streptomyces sp. SID8367]RAJ85158.1 alcohol dehydrogenase class IV [Streptomyces sp. PsTaAH-137]